LGGLIEDLEWLASDSQKGPVAYSEFASICDRLAALKVCVNKDIISAVQRACIEQKYLPFVLELAGKPLLAFEAQSRRSALELVHKGRPFGMLSEKEQSAPNLRIRDANPSEAALLREKGRETLGIRLDNYPPEINVSDSNARESF
jgi:hypothetical protein